MCLNVLSSRGQFSDCFMALPYARIISNIFKDWKWPYTSLQWSQHNFYDSRTVSPGKISESTMTALFFLPSCWQSALAQVMTLTMFSHLLPKQSSHGILFPILHQVARPLNTTSQHNRFNWSKNEFDRLRWLGHRRVRIRCAAKKSIGLDLPDVGQPASLTDRFPHL